MKRLLLSLLSDPFVNVSFIDSVSRSKGLLLPRVLPESET